MHIRPANAKHAGDTGPTQVNIQDANLMDVSAVCIFNYCICTYIIPNLSLSYSFSLHGLNMRHPLFCYTCTQLELTFFPACLRASANSVVMVLLPTPPFPDSTNTTCRTWAKFASHMKKRRGTKVSSACLRVPKIYTKR